MRTTVSALGLALLCPLACGILHAATPGQTANTLDTQIRVKINYLLYLPEGYEQKGPWPLLLFLHGAGERGTDLAQVKLHGPPKLIAAGKSFPFIVVSPQCPPHGFWSSEVVQLTALLDDIVARYKVDRDRVYVTGLSMGGFGTWSLAAYAPDRFAAIVPICGGGEVFSTRLLTHLPVWAFHGAKDPAVPVRRSQEMIDALKKQNAPARLTVYPDALHDSWTATYNNPEVYTWLLMQKRTAASQSPSDSRRSNAK